MTNASDTVVPPELADVLAAAAAPASPAELAGEHAAIVAFRAARPASTGTQPRRILGRKAAIAALGAFGLVGLGGVAAASTGSLPDGAQDAAHDALTKVGLEVPRGKGLATAPGQLKKAAQDGAAKDKAAKDKAAKEPGTKKDQPAAPDGAKAGAGQGGTISSIAKDPTLSGADKGAAVSSAASDGKSGAGQDPGQKATPNGPPSSLPGGPPASSPGATAPGRATASTAGPRAGSTP